MTSARAALILVLAFALRFMDGCVESFSHLKRAADVASFIGLILGCFLTFVMAGQAFAQSCTASMSNLAFGSFNPLTGAQSTTATLSVSCSGKKNKTVRLCVSASGVDPDGGCRLMKSGGNQLAFGMYSDAAHSQDFGSYYGGGGCAVGSWGATDIQVDLPLGSGGNATTSRTVYAGLNDSLAKPGNYTASYSIDNIAVDYIYDYGASCSAVISSGGPQYTRPTLSITASVQAACNVAAANLNFGSLSLLNSDTDTTSTISVQCTNGTPFNVGLNAGNGIGATVAARKMTSGGNTIVYSLYQNGSRTTVWGNTVGTNTASGTGTGSNQNLTVFGRVPAQITPPPATYNDTIVVTVTY